MHSKIIQTLVSSSQLIISVHLSLHSHLFVGVTKSTGLSQRTTLLGVYSSLLLRNIMRYKHNLLMSDMLFWMSQCQVGDQRHPKLVGFRILNLRLRNPKVFVP